MRVSELSGPLLNCWVEKCLRPEEKIFYNADGYTLRWHRTAPDYCGDWALGGPVLQNAGIAVFPDGRFVDPCDPSSFVASEWRASGPVPTAAGRGQVPLVAAMRCFVASRYGDSVPMAASENGPNFGRVDAEASAGPV